MAELSELSSIAIEELASLFFIAHLPRSIKFKTCTHRIRDFELVAKVSDLIFRPPKSFGFMDERGLEACCWHGKQWVFGSTIPIDDSDPIVTYAFVKQKLRNFTCSPTFRGLMSQGNIDFKHDVLSPFDHVKQQHLEQASDVLVLLYNSAMLVKHRVNSFTNLFLRSDGSDLSCLCKLSDLIFRGYKKKSRPRLHTCFKFGRLLLSQSPKLITCKYPQDSRSYAYIYEKLRNMNLVRFNELKPFQKLPVLEPEPADDGSEVTHHRKLKLDRGGRVFRIGSDISRSGSDISPIWTSPLLESILSPLTIVTQRSMLAFYCDQILYGENEEEDELEYIEHLHILLQSDSRLDEFVPKKVVTYLMKFLVYENVFHYLELKDIDSQTHIISILCNAVRSLEIGEEMRKNLIENLMRLIDSDSMYMQAELLFGLARLSKFDEYRRHLLKLGILEKLVKVARRGNNVILPDCALLFSVICFSQRNLPVDKGGDAALQIAIYLIRHRGCNYKVAAQAFSALAYLSLGRYVAIEGASCKRLMLYISDDEDLVAVSALEVVGNIVRWGKVRQITIMIKNGILKHLRRLLSHKFIMVRKEACWIISNITVGRKMCLKDLCEVNLPYSLCNLLEADDLDLRMEAVWAIFNSIIYDDHDEQIDYPNRSRTCPYILGQTRKIAPQPSVRVMVNRLIDYVPEVEK